MTLLRGSPEPAPLERTDRTPFPGPDPRMVEPDRRPPGAMPHVVPDGPDPVPLPHLDAWRPRPVPMPELGPDPDRLVVPRDDLLPGDSRSPDD